MDSSVMEIIFTFIGGLGIFLYGIKQMGDGLQAAAGDRLRNILNTFTSNPIMGVLAGMIVTILIQSSSGTTVITIGLVSAGFMTMRQAIGVVMGANIGTTVTAFIIGIDIGAYALPILAIGAFLIFFIQKRKVKNIGMILFGFGALFYGLELMSGAVKPLADLEGFKQLMLDMSFNPIYGLIAGTILTVVIQSSSATIGILQGFFANDLISLHGALPVLLGDNIGTTITAVLASLAGSLAAKRVAAVHVMFNVIGASIFLIILPLYQMAIEWMQSLLNLKPEMVIAFAHGTFNVTNTLIQLPFIFVLAWVVTKIVPGEDLNEKYKPRNLDRNLINRAPSIALQEAQEEIQNIGHMTFSMLKNVNEYDDKKERDIMHKHAAIDNMNDNVRQYLTKISEKKLSKKDAERMTVLQDVNRTILKVAGLSEAYLLDKKKEQTNQVQISKKAEASINRLYDHVTTSFDKTIDMFDVYDRVKRDEIVKISNESYRLEHDLRKKHIKRLSSGECTPEGGLLYLDMIGILERIGYHSRNISESMIDIDEIETNEETEHALEWSH
ncbi:Na/Pi cotransporter family protein [Staphylococcus saprophyticus]|jgi:phosphate:Na+ symporter|uniref:Na/Pi cotransporter family protein n=1 Tax=Staphylococcus saprophyticus TaxID=29385 RepID=UPI001642CCEF|nr:Na/Pi cotransporter family protein [Staphylococcus saprophyticus]MBC2919860.1 Na/Pi cotransporter family protein [Staphylococcus saprophyticus]MBC2957148.1 Na/Pi cotransporter family protein [Staphylococcus saprophyticus]MBC3008730.1 Na/Pi cotransporter family protein [Staphylococcus saprophyticus]MBC3022179.1 Na/Pi cotransporter family protein [Staphylococcus saprophyticus]MBC3030132.1 Na/Pi cotransporter family protein [Staphylococcus saprophyticus]